MINRSLYISFLALILSFSCQNNSEEIIENIIPVEQINNKELKEEVIEEIVEAEEETVVVISEFEQKLIDAGLVDIQDVDSTLRVEVLYATENNFMNRVIYDGYDKVYLQKVVAERLSQAQQALKDIDSTLSLIVFDGTRPRSVQQEMWDALDTVPVNERVKFLSNPKNGSVHNYGAAVDLSIIDLKTGLWLDMGAGYDDPRKIAYPRHEERFLASGELTKEQVENRKLLRKVMRVGGFWVIETEWWHFNAFTRNKAKELFDIVE